jgi:gliding motility-associated-like protein
MYFYVKFKFALTLKLKHKFSIIFSLLFLASFGQDVTLYNQFNGRFDFTMIGNTMNPIENTFMLSPPTILTTSSATLNLNSTDVIEKAYLYWAGSGTGDFNVKLNNIDIIPERTFSHTRINGDTYNYFSAFKDVTSQIIASGNGNYTISELDVSPFIASHYNIKTNFAGWAIVVIYKNSALPLNQLNIYDGLEAVPTSVDITLNSLNVIDNVGAKIGFLAWEGDVGLAVNETLRFNGNILSNSLNPAGNQFNGTNTFTGSTTLYNMDLDVYDIQNNINIGDTTAQIQLTSGQDFVMINVVATKLNSQLPDATIAINNFTQSCNSRQIVANYTVSNVNSTAPLPAGTSIAIYANSTLIGNTTTSVILQIGESVSGQITLTIPNTIPLNFILKFIVDDNGTGVGTIVETNELNNNATQNITLWISPTFNIAQPLSLCQLNPSGTVFDFSAYENSIKTNPTDVVSFYESLLDAQNNTNPITNAINYIATTTPKQIFVRIKNTNCESFSSFLLITKNCSSTIPNGVTPNGDGQNDTFFINRDLYPNFELAIYNRWGFLVWKGDNTQNDWDGSSNRGIVLFGNQLPDGTYFYILKPINNTKYPDSIASYLYLSR